MWRIARIKVIAVIKSLSSLQPMDSSIQANCSFFRWLLRFIRFVLNLSWQTRDDKSMLKVSFIQMNHKLRHALCTDQINYLNSDKSHFALHHINCTPRDVIDMYAWRIDHFQSAINSEAQTNWWSSISLYSPRSCMKIEAFKNGKVKEIEKEKIEMSILNCISARKESSHFIYWSRFSTGFNLLAR